MANLTTHVLYIFIPLCQAWSPPIWCSACSRRPITPAHCGQYGTRNARVAVLVLHPQGATFTSNINCFINNYIERGSEASVTSGSPRPLTRILTLFRELSCLSLVPLSKYNSEYRLICVSDSSCILLRVHSPQHLSSCPLFDPEQSLLMIQWR
jgi:hypothetical protein